MIGLTGPQRSGKTTLADAFAKEAQIPALHTSAGATLARLGIDPKQDYPLAQRLDAQRHILDDIEKQYRSVSGGVFVADRTPICMLAYLLADIQRTNVPPELEGVVKAYMDDCIEVSNSTFGVLMALQPGVKAPEVEKSAPGTFAYSEHVSALCMGLLVSERIESSHFYMPRYMLDLGTRVEAISLAVRRAQERFIEQQKRSKDAGRAMVFH